MLGTGLTASLNSKGIITLYKASSEISSIIYYE